jgi:hypothetical protein
MCADAQVADCSQGICQCLSRSLQAAQVSAEDG